MADIENGNLCKNGGCVEAETFAKMADIENGNLCKNGGCVETETCAKMTDVLKRIGRDSAQSADPIGGGKAPLLAPARHTCAKMADVLKRSG